MTDQEALKKYVTSGNPDAFATLVQRYERMVHATCIRVLGRSPDVDDIVQEAFVQLATNAKRIRTSPRAWLHQCTFHLAAKFRRSTEARSRREEAWAAITIEPTTSGDSQDWRELLRDVDACITELPPKPRAAVIGYYLSGRKLSDLAKEEGISIPGMKKRIDRALDLLRERLRQRGTVTTLSGMQAAFAKGMLPVEVSATVSMSLLKVGVSGVGTSATATGMSIGLKAALVTVVAAGVITVSTLLLSENLQPSVTGGRMAGSEPLPGHEQTRQIGRSVRQPHSSRFSDAHVGSSADMNATTDAKKTELANRLRAIMALDSEERLIALRKFGEEYAPTIQSKEALDRILAILGTTILNDRKHIAEFEAAFEPIAGYWSSRVEAPRFGNWMFELHQEKGKTTHRPNSVLIIYSDDPYQNGLALYGRTWLQRNTEGYTTWLLSLPEQRPDKEIAAMGIKDWIKGKPDEAGQFFEKVFALRAEARAKDPDNTSILTQPILTSYSHLLTIQWISDDVVHAAGKLGEWVHAYPDDGILPWLCERVAEEWAKVDLDASYQWVSALESEEARSLSIRGMIVALAADAPEDAAKWFQTFPPGETRTRSAYSLGLHWAYTGQTDEAWQWAVSLTDADQKTEALKGVAAVKAQTDWLGTLVNINKMPATEKERTEVANFMMSRARVFPGQVTEALGVITDEGMQKKIVQRSVLSYPHGDEPSAAAWALSFEDARHRQTAIETAYGRWIDTDEVAANTWLETTAMSGTEKESLKTLYSLKKNP